jgi:hypothetical protein
MPVEAGGLKPGREGVNAAPGFDKVQELVPDIYNFRFSANLCSSCHHNGKKARKRPEKKPITNEQAISTDVKKLWKANLP